MHYVIIRDDDTNPFTPPEYLDRLYRPFLDHGLPVNLAVIPEVHTSARMADGRPEGFLVTRKNESREFVPIDSNPGLLAYLFSHSGYHFAQHGLHHDYLEFDSSDRAEIRRRLDRGTRLLLDCGFPKPTTFVAPYDKFSRMSIAETAKRFAIISTGWLERERLPLRWWPRYFWSKITSQPHLRLRRTTILTHPGCLLSCYRCYETILDEVKRAVLSQPLTVLVSHWWEYFRNGTPDDDFIQILHQVASWCASDSNIRVISFDDLATPRSEIRHGDEPHRGLGRVVSEG